MEADLQSFVAFYLTGKKPADRLEDIGKDKLRPALFAAYRDLTRLRYDFPLVLVDAAEGEGFAEPLSGLVDDILDKVAQGADAERIRKNVLRLEQEIRARLAHGEHGLFSALWDKAAKPLAKEDPAIADSLARARANLKIDGEVLDLLERRGLLATSCFIEKVGSPDERIVHDLATLRDTPVNYLSLLLVRNPKRQRGELRRGCRRRLEAPQAADA